MNTRRSRKKLIKDIKAPKLTQVEIKTAKRFYKKRGYKLQNTYFHRYYKAMTGEFHADYIPLDIFRPYICPEINSKKQWPALIDKNFTYTIFKDFKQPEYIIQNINGFYSANSKIITEEKAIELCNAANKKLLIKPTIDSGRGKDIIIFTVNDNLTSLKQTYLKDLFRRYNKDFIVQYVLEQSDIINQLNPSSLNTIRVVTYLKDNTVYVLSSALRIGGPGNETDNFSGDNGAMFCGIKDNGALKSYGINRQGKKLPSTASGVTLAETQLPNYALVTKMVKEMHPIVPYFKLISWDIAIDKENDPVLIEYNTYGQGLEIQIPNGPLFGEFTDEILALGRK
ncbi:MAG: hypothetical protein HKN40_05745 [Winogradskyella sp.]|uniref:sugar-transfer associated ATP-grasp domain-containing protein n=1 Tax=Winogradskyella sp. TaxID=1883156 RepID=UPI001794ACA1|nr:hypothetical protein [Winogradskyella sp.]